MSPSNITGNRTHNVLNVSVRCFISRPRHVPGTRRSVKPVFDVNTDVTQVQRDIYVINSASPDSSSVLNLSHIRC